MNADEIRKSVRWETVSEEEKTQAENILRLLGMFMSIHDIQSALETIVGELRVARSCHPSQDEFEQFLGDAVDEMISKPLSWDTNVTYGENGYPDSGETELSGEAISKLASKILDYLQKCPDQN